MSLPEELRRQFAALDRRLWRTETWMAVCVAASALLVCGLLLFISDRFWDTPVWLRVALTSIGGACLALVALLWLKQWVVHRRDQRDLAVLVQGRYRRLGDRLLGVVELADEEARPAYFSPALYRAAIEQVAGEARQFDFREAVEPKTARVCGAVLLALLGLALVPVLLCPGAALNAARRWIAPTAAIPRFTLLKLEGLPAEQIVPHGEPFEVTCQVRYRSLWRPARAWCQFARQPAIGTTVQGEQVRVRVPGQVQRGNLKIRVGDARAEVPIVPTHRPSLQELAAAIELPAYLQHPVQKERAESGSLAVLEGSRVTFEGKASRALAEAQVTIRGLSEKPLRVEREKFSTEPLQLDDASEIAFTWRDELGLANAAPWRLQIQPQKDGPPTPELPDLQKDSAMLQGEVLDIRARAVDDYGVREVGLEWQLLTDWQATSNSLPAQRFLWQARNPQEKKVEEIFHFSPTLLQIPADSIVELRGFAVDYLPDRQRSETPVYRIHVLGNEQHAELVRQNLESLLSHLEEITRLEEKLAATTRELQALPKDKQDTAEAAERLASAQQDQRQNASGLEQMAREGQKTLREAFRNPTFTEETLREWAKTLKEMQGLSEEQMQQAVKALKAAQEDASARSENLSQALQKEEEIMEALEQMQRSVNKGLDQLQALTLAQRLRKIASDEEEIAGRLQRIVPETIGMLPKEVPARHRKTELSLATEQESTQKEAAELHGEIGRFSERTQKENYGQVNKEMTDSHITDEFDRMRGLIQDNIAMDAMQNLAQWSDRLKTWADLLEPKSESSSGGGGGGGGSSADDTLIKELMALLRARDHQTNLRQRTGLLDNESKSNPGYTEAAKALAARQGQVREEVVRIQEENPIPALEFPLQDIVDHMQGSEALLHVPQTDRETDLVQTRAIEGLSDLINLINEQQQRNSSSSSQSNASAEEAAFLMKMMAQQRIGTGAGLNPKGGGSMAGGTTDRAATAMPGDTTGRAGETRQINRAGGSSVNLPTEFRDALENYYRAVEQLEQKR